MLLTMDVKEALQELANEIKEEILKRVDKYGKNRQG